VGPWEAFILLRLADEQVHMYTCTNGLLWSVQTYVTHLSGQYHHGAHCNRQVGGACALWIRQTHLGLCGLGHGASCAWELVFGFSSYGLLARFPVIPTPKICPKNWKRRGPWSPSTLFGHCLNSFLHLCSPRVGSLGFSWVNTKAEVIGSLWNCNQYQVFH
jgi:hypothetical protein